MECGSITNSSPSTALAASLCKDVRDLDKLFSSILEVGKGNVILYFAFSGINLSTILFAIWQ